ncbi:mycothiol transferase [Brachybacterium hainanense]|uniref:DUF664 domain-containing protein n=1 Tax=Brachybacterium hainanense TaxID=1541174 RepID=A0ABV6RAR9_9MICO
MHSDPAPETEQLLRSLQSSRDHVISQVEAMAEADRHVVHVPSDWSPLGLVRHLTLSDERYWFEVVVAGGSLDYWPDGDRGDWQVPAGMTGPAVLDEYRAACAATDAIIRSVSLDAPPKRPEPEWESSGAFADVRTILLHHLVETSIHAGQLDVARELADGGQHLVL